MNINRQKLEDMRDAEVDELFSATEKRDKVKVRVSFRDSNGQMYLSKEIHLVAVPVRGCYFEYEPGWGLHWMDDRSSLYITQSVVEVSAVVHFSDEEVESLVSLGWRKE